MKHAFYFLTAFLLVTMGITANAQENVGIGTLSPNLKALLDLSSNSKGFLVPRMNTNDRLAINPQPGPSNPLGLMTYDTNDSLFYFWNGAQWKYFPAKPGDSGWIISGNNEYAAVSGNVGIGVSLPSLPTAKLHTQGTVRFHLLGSTTTQTEVLTVDANGNVKTRMLGNDLWDGDSVDDADPDPTNECVNSMVYDVSSQTLSLFSDCGVTTATIPTDPNDNDKDPTNEFQDLSSTTLGSTVTIAISDGASTSFNNNDADASATNEIQALTVNKSGIDVNWSLSNGGGSGTFSVDDNDWAGAGTGSMYPTTLTDKVGIGTSTPTYRLDVTGDGRVTGKQYFTSADYYIQNSGSDLLFFSDDNMKFETNNDHLVTFFETGTEAIANFNLDGEDVLTMRGNGTYDFAVGIGTSTPAEKLQVAGNVRIGLINAPGFTNGGDNYGEQLYFSGGPGFGGGLDSENDDVIFLARYNESSDVSELRIGIGDDQNSSGANLDRLSIGSVTPGGALSTFTGLFDFDIENPNSSNGPMLSITPRGFVHAKTYHGGLAISKPLGSNGQYINLARTDANNILNVWSLGYVFGTSKFAIHEGSTNDASFATNDPHFSIVPGTGYVGMGVDNVSVRLELPGDAGPAGTGRAFEWTELSDGRFKSERQDIGTVLAKIMELNPIYYKWENYTHDSRGKIHGTGKISDSRELGFIAQDVYEIFPEVVQKPKDQTMDSWTMDYGRLTAVLTKAIQEQQEMLVAEKDAHQQTKAELEDLKDEVEQLRNSVNRINLMLGRKAEASVKVPNN